MILSGNECMAAKRPKSTITMGHWINLEFQDPKNHLYLKAKNTVSHGLTGETAQTANISNGRVMVTAKHRVSAKKKKAHQDRRRPTCNRSQIEKIFGTFQFPNKLL